MRIQFTLSQVVDWKSKSERKYVHCGMEESSVLRQGYLVRDSSRSNLDETPLKVSLDTLESLRMILGYLH